MLVHEVHDAACDRCERRFLGYATTEEPTCSKVYGKCLDCDDEARRVGTILPADLTNGTEIGDLAEAMVAECMGTPR